MPGTVDDGPTVPASFANNFWGKEDAGVGPMLERMHGAKVTSDELKGFYNTRAAIEDEYARKLLALCRKPLGSCETGTLRSSLDVLRGEVELMAKTHQSIAVQMKSELEEPLVAFAGGLKERRKIVQGGIEKLHKVKVQQTQAVNKSRDRFEQDCLRIKGYLAQGHMVMGQEERKNKSKLEKTQIQMASNSNEFESAVKILEETTSRWNRDWKAACDKFQDFEEERIDFTKSSLWTFANIASTVCVSDDAACEKIRLSLENCEVEKDIKSFVIDKGTGQEIPDPPKYVNFNRGDIDDSASEASQEEYSVAQFQRQINPTYRTSSPAPSTLESHHNPIEQTSRSRESTMTPQRHGQPDLRRHAAEVQSQFDQQSELAAVPHNEYPADGMTMFCRTDNTSDLSANSAYRPSSRDTDLSDPTSLSSVEPVSARPSPTKQAPPLMGSPGKPIQKKRSGFFSNSPFRRKSKHEKERPASRFGVSSTRGDATPSRNGVQTHDFAQDDTSPVDPRASFQLNVGQNVFDVASPDAPGRGSKPLGSQVDDSDPIAAALAELKGVAKQPASRVTADRYAGMATPAPGSQPRHAGGPPGAGLADPPPSYHEPSGTVRRLDAPQPAHTAAQMRAATSKYTTQSADIYGTPTRRGGAGTHAGAGVERGMPRSASPLPMRGTSPRPGMHPDTMRRSASPQPGYEPGQQQQQQQQQQRRQRPQSQYQPSTAGGGSMRPSPQYSRHERPQSAGNPAASSAGGGQMMLHGGGGGGDGGALGQGRRPMSQYGGQAGGDGGRMDGGRMDGGRMDGGRTEGGRMEGGRTEGRGAGRGRGQGSGQFTRDGREIIHFAKAMYTYSAAIPEELSFTKGEVLAVLRLQDDGWWEAEVTTKKGVPGLVPSNYLQRI